MDTSFLPFHDCSLAHADLYSQLNESNKNINNQSNEQKVTKSHPLNTDKLFNYNEITGINKVVLGKQKIESIALNCLINNNNNYEFISINPFCNEWLPLLSIKDIYIINIDYIDYYNKTLSLKSMHDNCHTFNSDFYQKPNATNHSFHKLLVDLFYFLDCKIINIDSFNHNLNELIKLVKKQDPFNNYIFYNNNYSIDNIFNALEDEFIYFNGKYSILTSLHIHGNKYPLFLEATSINFNNYLNS